jgi:Family of unknown function (DUF6335)
MAKRKTATRAGRAAGRGEAAGAKAAAAASRRGRTTKETARKSAAATSPKASGRRTAAGKSAPTRPAPAKGSNARARSAGRQRKQLDDVTAEVQRRSDLEEEEVPTPPSTLSYESPASAARSGRATLAQRRREHTETTPAITGGDVDADWEGAYAVGDEAATGDNPTPDQDTVEGLGRAVGVEYEDSEELKSTPKIERRDKKRWELDPASAEDYPERNRKRERS